MTEQAQCGKHHPSHLKNLKSDDGIICLHTVCMCGDIRSYFISFWRRWEFSHVLPLERWTQENERLLQKSYLHPFIYKYERKSLNYRTHYKTIWGKWHNFEGTVRAVTLNDSSTLPSSAVETPCFSSMFWPRVLNVTLWKEGAGKRKGHDVSPQPASKNKNFAAALITHVAGGKR